MLNLVGEEGSDAAEELQLLLQGVTTLLRHVHHVKDRRSQVSQSRDGLHLNGVPLLQGVVQYARGVHHLKSASLVNPEHARHGAVHGRRDRPASGGTGSPCDPQTGTWW